MTTPTLTEALGRLRRSIEWLRDGKPHANGIGVADMVVLEDGFRARAAEIERLTKLADERGANEARMLERNAELQAEVERLRGLAATCYAGLGAECDLPEAWLDALNAAANGEPFSTEGLLPYIAAPAQQDTTAPAGRARLAESGGSRACAVVPAPAQQAEPCDMGEICIGCQPRAVDGGCPHAEQAPSLTVAPANAPKTRWRSSSTWPATGS
jgi:hypothetical protein